MPETRVHDPAVGFRFQVSVAQRENIAAGFSKVSGLRDESEIAEYREGTDALVKTKLPGLRTFPNLVMERGMMTESDELVKWRKDAIRCVKGYRADVKVTVYNCDRSPARFAEFSGAWPLAYQLADLDAGASEVNIESVELVHEGKVFDTLFTKATGGAVLDPRSGRFSGTSTS